METTSDICKQFHSIAESGFLVADSTLQRKAVVSVRKGKLVFSQQQLKQVVIMLMGDLPYFLFDPSQKPKITSFSYSGLQASMIARAKFEEKRMLTSKR